jgi:hypothetical protein
MLAAVRFAATAKAVAKRRPVFYENMPSRRFLPFAKLSCKNTHGAACNFIASAPLFFCPTPKLSTSLPLAALSWGYYNRGKIATYT